MRPLLALRPARVVPLLLALALTAPAAAELRLLLTPPQGGFGPQAGDWRRQLAQRASTRLGDIANLRLVPAEQAQLALSRAAAITSRHPQLIAAYSLDARYVLTPSLLQRPGLPDVRLDLRDTLTGQALLTESASLSDPASLTRALDKLALNLTTLAAAPPDQPGPLFALAPLTLRSRVGRTDPDPTPDLLTEELRRCLSSTPRCRFLAPPLASYLAGAAHEQSPLLASSGLIVISGELATEMETNAPYAIHLSVRAKGKDTILDIAGRRDAAPALDQQAASALRAFLKDAGLDVGPQPGPAQLEQAAQNRQLLFSILTAIPDAWRTSEKEVVQALDLVQQASQQLPASTQPLLALRIALANPRLAAAPHGLPLIPLRQQFIESCPASPDWARIVCQQIRALRAAGRGDDELATARLLTDAMLTRLSPAPEWADDHPALQTFISHGEHQLAYFYALAAVGSGREHDTPALERLATYELDAGNTGYCLTALKSLHEFYPGRETAWLDKQGHAAKVANSELAEWFKPLLAARNQASATLPEPTSFNTWPQIPADLLPPAATLEPSQTIPVPKGYRLIALAAARELCALVTDNESRLALWLPATGACTPLPLPPTHYEETWRFLAAGDSAFLCGRGKAQWEIDLKTAATHELKFPDRLFQPHVFAAWVAGDKLYLAGACGKSRSLESGGEDERTGFIIARSPGKEGFEVYLAPADTGGVVRAAVQPSGDVILLHLDRRPFTRFSPATGQWKPWSLPSQQLYERNLRFAARPSALLVVPLDVLNARELYRFDPSSWQHRSVFYTPSHDHIPSYPEYVHRWFWSPSSQEAIPLSGPPVDLADDGEWFWIVDCRGTLAGSPDAEEYAGPFKIAPTALAAAAHNSRLYVASSDTLRVFELSQLRQLVARDGATRPARKVFSDTRAALERWSQQLPPASRGAYFKAQRDFPRAAEAYFASDLVKTREGALAVSRILLEAGRDRDVLELLKPYAAAIKDLNVTSLEANWLSALQGDQQWDELLELIPRLWKESPLRGPLIPVDKRFWPYRDAFRARHSDQEYERWLWDLMDGKFPPAAWAWADDPTHAAVAEQLRKNARRCLIMLLAEQRQFATLLSNPSFGRERWDDENLGDAWLLYLALGQADEALHAAKNPPDRARVLVHLGRFADALKMFSDSSITWNTWTLDTLSRAALYEGRWDLYDECLRRSDALWSQQPASHRRQIIALLRHHTPAATAFAAAERFEFLKDSPKAINAYEDCARRHPGSLAAAESLLRLAEFAWLDRRDDRAAAAAFDLATAAYTAFAAQPPDLRAFALFRLGMIARVYHRDLAAAQDHWQRAAALTGLGAQLSRFGLASLKDAPPLIAVADTQNPKPLPIATVSLGAANLVQHYSDGRRRALTSHLYAPVEGSQHSEDYWGALHTWYYYLWYPAASFRPGIAWAYVESEGQPHLTWILLQSPAPAATTRPTP